MILDNGDMLTVLSGGVANATTVVSGQVAVDGTVSGTVIQTGNEFIYNGGTALGTTISSGGVEAVSSGGVASGTRVLSGGREHV